MLEPQGLYKSLKSLTSRNGPNRASPSCSSLKLSLKETSYHRSKGSKGSPRGLWIGHTIDDSRGRKAALVARTLRLLQKAQAQVLPAERLLKCRKKHRERPQNASKRLEIHHSKATPAFGTASAALADPLRAVGAPLDSPRAPGWRCRPGATLSCKARPPCPATLSATEELEDFIHDKRDRIRFS